MDDQSDRDYSRAPELEDLLNLCKALNAEGVRYLGRKELLIETKQTVRPSDAVDVQFLRLRIAAEHDPSST